MTVIQGRNAKVQISPDGGKTWVDFPTLNQEREPDMQATNWNGHAEPEALFDNQNDASAAAAKALERAEIEYVTVRKMQNPRISRAANLRHAKPGR